MDNNWSLYMLDLGVWHTTSTRELLSLILGFLSNSYWDWSSLDGYILMNGGWHP